MADTEDMVIGEGRLDESTVAQYESVVGEVVWPREPGPPSKVKRGKSIKDVLLSVLAAGPTGLTVLHQNNVGAALELAVSHYRKRPIRESDTARRSRQATGRTMSNAGLLIVRRGVSNDGDPFLSFTLTTAGREMAEEVSGQKPGQAQFPMCVHLYSPPAPCRR